MRVAEAINRSAQTLSLSSMSTAYSGGAAGEHLHQCCAGFARPSIVTLHTVLALSNDDQRRVLCEIIGLLAHGRRDG